MPTSSQLQSEAWWRREFQPPTLAALCEQLREHFGVTAAALGSKGDANHLYGYHRSRAWIISSAWSAFRWNDYSIQAPADQEGDENWLSAVDFTPGDANTMIEVCQRLDGAARAGLCPQLREWYGNVDGDQVVDGWDLLANRAASSDSSHLWHLHMSFLRGRAGDDHSNLFAILTGASVPPPTLGGRTMYVVNAPGDFTLWLSDGFQRKPIFSIEQASAYLTGGAAVRLVDVPLDWFGKELAAGTPVQFTPEELAQISTAARQGAHEGAEDAVDGATIHVG